MLKNLEECSVRKSELYDDICSALTLYEHRDEETVSDAKDFEREFYDLLVRTQRYFDFAARD